MERLPFYPSYVPCSRGSVGRETVESERFSAVGRAETSCNCPEFSFSLKNS